MFKDANGEFDDYSISPKIRQILLRWGYELTEKDFSINCTKMSYYQFNRQEILQKAKNRYSKEKTFEYQLKKQRRNKKSQRIDTKTCQKKKKARLKIKISAINLVEKSSIKSK